MITLPAAYLAPVSYYAAVVQHPEGVQIEAHEHFVKQTWRSRTTIATDQGPLVLSVCVAGANRPHVPIREVRLSDHGNWLHNHLYALATYYGHTPFYEYYIDDLRHVYTAGHDGTLFGLNEALRQHLFSELGITTPVTYTSAWCGYDPESRRPRWQTSPLTPPPYYQVASHFGQQPFMTDVSVLDLLFNLGPEALAFLARLPLSYPHAS